MRIQHNIMAMNAYRNYNKNTSALSKNLEKLSSGYRINRAGDDAAGLAISEKMRAQITGLNAAQKNVKDGISLVKTAEGAMQEIHDMLNRMDYLATQSANGTYDDPVDRLNLQKEVDALRTEINRIADSANFNGISLLDGSLDSNSTGEISTESGITEVTVNDYQADRPSDAFEASFITNRPPATTCQTTASFKVSLDDFNFSGVTDNDEFTLKVGDATLKYKVVAADNVTDATSLAGALASCGCTIAAGSAGKVTATYVSATGGVTGGVKTDTDTWNAAMSGQSVTDDPAAGKNYVKIDGHWWKMSASDNELTFEQVDYSAEGSADINPDYNIKLELKDMSNAGGTGATDTEAKLTGTCNWQAQEPATGHAKGSSHQAQAEVTIDFSKLKDGDKLTAGDLTYVFKVGKDSTLATGTSAGTATQDSTKTIDLSKIFAEESDLTDSVKQAQALDLIVKEMAVTPEAGTGSGGNGVDAVNNAWSVGNGGLRDGKGTLTFQSRSEYVGDGTTADTDDLFIAGNSQNDTVDMRTEESVMKQFYATSKKTAASVDIGFDVTKLKEGDTFTINGTTFEIADGTNTSSKDYVAIDLSSFNVKDGILSNQQGSVMETIKTAVSGAIGTTDYDITVDGNKLTLTSKEDSTTTKIFEERIAAKVELPQGAYAGKALTLQIGDTADDFNQLSVSVGDMHTTALKIDGINIGNQEDAKAAIQSIKDAINYVSGVRGDLGAVQNRLEHTANNLSVMAENIQDAESTIRDTDVAEEMMAYTKNNILIQSAQAMLAQANAVPQGVLQLLG